MMPISLCGPSGLHVDTIRANTAFPKRQKEDKTQGFE
jgi:hypothetical protein